jgi:fused signal recognition particle receptor
MPGVPSGFSRKSGEVMGLADRLGLRKLKQTLEKTRNGLVAKIVRIASSRSTIDDTVLSELEEALITSDVGVDASESVVEAIRKGVREQRYSSTDELDRIVKEQVLAILAVAPQEKGDWTHRPHVVMVVGVNGVGKTTTIGKLARWYRNEGKSVLIAAADTFRAAASEQLEIWAQRAGADIVVQAAGADPGAVAFDALKSATAKGSDVTIVDTAGRLHTRVSLMEELKKVKRVIEKGMPGAPHEILLVIDANTGQNGLEQARQFTQAIGVTGLVLTKLDGTARGGIVLTIAAELGVPVRFVGLGEGIDDLQQFNAAEFVDAIFSR